MSNTIRWSEPLRYRKLFGCWAGSLSKSRGDYWFVGNALNVKGPFAHRLTCAARTIYRPDGFWRQGFCANSYLRISSTLQIFPQPCQGKAVCPLVNNLKRRQSAPLSSNCKYVRHISSRYHSSQPRMKTQKNTNQLPPLPSPHSCSWKPI